MDRQLRSRLEKLNSELHDLDPGSPGARSAADSLRTTVRSILEEPRIDPVRHGQPLYQQLKDSLFHFEAAHPTLSASVQNVIDTLVQLGI